MLVDKVGVDSAVLEGLVAVGDTGVGTKTAVSGPSSTVAAVPNPGPSRRSTQAPNTRLVATETSFVLRLCVEAAGDTGLGALCVIPP